MTGPEATNINRIWADLLVEELVRAGVGLFCLAPGSRSTPLTTAVAANPRARDLMHFDERGSAFCALGFARATRRPAAWITTSGTAVANGMPAVVEAATDGVPMVLLTADRPPELRATGANQTVDQVKLFGDYVRWAFDLPVPTVDIDPAFVLTTADQAVYRARRAPSGPVHLNAMFREPLAPDPDGGSYADYLIMLGGWMERDEPYTRYAGAPPYPTDEEVGALWARLEDAERGLIVAGRLDTRAQADAVRRLSDRLAWPVLPDVCSQLRLGGGSRPDHPAYYYDLMLTHPTFTSSYRPDAVLQFGARPTSKRLGRYLADARPATHIVVCERPDRIDPRHGVTDRVEADVVRFCRAVVEQIDEERAAGAWTRGWTAASESVQSVLDEHVPRTLSEPAVARLVTALAPEGSGLVLASSMPVRDVDMYGSVVDGAARGEAPLVVANRGASGIDGTVATAAGLAAGLQRLTTLVIGDLALLHDLNSLALIAASTTPVVVLAVNNQGGGIFSFLPIAEHEDVFEPYFGTPHAYEFEHAAAVFGLPYERARSVAELEAAYAGAVEDGRSCLIEVRTNRSDNLQRHRRLEALAAGAIEP
ncbi:MAG: 2-succinyl-5-enolpyruvyl-6-hydroxy-3-cyclohexene-1-carboxylic-acid synthase [Rhodothermales bacterium]